MKQTTQRSVRLVEYRIFSLPQTLTADALRKCGKEKSAGLLDLRNWWVRTGKNEVATGAKYETFSEHGFENTQKLVFKATPHPENTVTAPEGGELLSISLEENAVAMVHEYLGVGPKTPNSWKLDSFSVHVPALSRFGIQIATFIPTDADKLQPENIDQLTNHTARQIDKLWPLVYSALRNADHTIFGTSKASDAGLWATNEPSFGLPGELAMQPELEPTEEYDFYCTLFVKDCSDWARSCQPFDNIASGEGFKKYDISEKYGREEIHLSRAMTLWQIPSTVGVDVATERVLRTSLASRLMKNLTFNYRLLACALKNNYLDGNKLEAEDLRGIAFRYDITHQALSERRQYLSKSEYDLVQLHLELSDFNEYVSNCRYLSERVLIAAESVDADAQRKFERRLQGIALVFSAFALITVILDGYNFIFGQPGEMPFNFSVRRMILSGAISALAFAALVFVFKTRTERRPRRSR